jgi:hypothetical protein
MLKNAALAAIAVKFGVDTADIFFNRKAHLDISVIF